MGLGLIASGKTGSSASEVSFVGLGHLHVCPSYSSQPIAQKCGCIWWDTCMSGKTPVHCVYEVVVLAYKIAESSEADSARGLEKETEGGCVWLVFSIAVFCSFLFA